jgi:hypothetical protein
LTDHPKKTTLSRLLEAFVPVLIGTIYCALSAGVFLVAWGGLTGRWPAIAAGAALLLFGIVGSDR